jgi:hypothetical protein
MFNKFYFVCKHPELGGGINIVYLMKGPAMAIAPDHAKDENLGKLTIENLPSFAM